MSNDNWTAAQKKLAKELEQIKTLDNRGVRDRLWAEAYEKSGCTQAQIAQVHGCSRVTVTCRLRFGRFCGWLSYHGNIEIPDKLNERRFRSVWEKTKGTDENRRFKECLEKLLVPWEPATNAARIRELFDVGEPFTPEEVAEKLERPLQSVKTTLHRMEKGEIGRWARVVSTPYKDTRRYRFVAKVVAKTKGDIQIPISEYAALVSDLKREVERVIDVVEGHTWASTSPEMISGQLKSVLKRLRAAEKFLKKEGARISAQDVPDANSGK